MREILFKGKRIDNDKWVIGSFVSYSDYVGDKVYSIFASNGNPNTVNPETIGQYTGLIDKNGTKIFEGDIVVMNIKGYSTICKVVWADNVAQFQLWQTNTISNTSTALNLGNYDCEVIGNIYDNPELLKECESGGR